MAARKRWRRTGLLGGVAISLAMIGCRTPEAAGETLARDLLTDVADDGSLMAGILRPDPTTRWVALRGLGRLAPGDLTPATLQLADTETSPPILAELCFTLGQWKDPAAAPKLRELAAHRSARVRAAAVEALGKLADDAHLPPLVRALADDSATVRGRAALALFRLDGRRYDHARTATPEQLAARDAALARVAQQDTDPEARWRAAYALAEIRSRPGVATVLQRCLSDAESPLARVFAARGLAHLAAEGLVDDVALVGPLVDDPDERVAIEAARTLAARGPLARLATLASGHASSHVRGIAVGALRTRLAAASGDEPLDGLTRPRDEILEQLWSVAENDASTAVRREAWAALAVVPEEEVAGPALAHLSRSTEPRDRERVARLLADGELESAELLDRLLDDPAASVRAAALGAIAPADLEHHEPRVRSALASDDPAVRGSAALLVAPWIAGGSAPPWLVAAVADAYESAKDYVMAEARVELATALGLPEPGLPDPPPPPRERLLDRLLAEHRAAQEDPEPRVRLTTSRGDVVLVLDRVTAPRHVESFLELVEAGFYDGLDIHRVVPNFVVQGLDPRADGWGVGGRRVPDEFNPTPYVAGVVGMPRTGAPHTGGCQVFITHVPTPHLDGAYSAFGRVASGMEVVAALEVGDVIESARRVDGEQAP